MYKLNNKTGSTLIELLIYISLLALISTLLFGLVLQVKRQQKNILIRHTSLHTQQMALDLIKRDISLSQSIEITRDGNKKNKLICKTLNGQIEWEQDAKYNLWRIDRQNNIKRQTRSKVAVDIQSFVVHAIKTKTGAILVLVKVINQQANKQVNNLAQQVLIRSSLKI